MEEISLYLLLLLVIPVFGYSALKPENLPPCPTNIDYFPQNLPMHCRVVRSASSSSSQSTSQPASPFYQSPPSDKQPVPVPLPVPHGPLPYPFPGAPPGPMPMPMPMQMPLPGPAHKLPVIVMPFYSPDPSFKADRDDHKHKDDRDQRRPRRPRRGRRPQRRPRRPLSDTSSSDDTDCSDTDTSSSSDTSSDISDLKDRGWWNHHKRPSKRSGRRSAKQSTKKPKRKHKEDAELLTPVLQYVTKDGYVIFEKQISKGEAKNWLEMRSDGPDPNKLEIKELNKKQTVTKPNEEDKDEYDEKSTENVRKQEEVSTAKSTYRAHRKHHSKPNLLLPG